LGGRVFIDRARRIFVEACLSGKLQEALKEVLGHAKEDQSVEYQDRTPPQMQSQDTPLVDEIAGGACPASFREIPVGSLLSGNLETAMTEVLGAPQEVAPLAEGVQDRPAETCNSGELEEAPKEALGPLQRDPALAKALHEAQDSPATSKDVPLAVQAQPHTEQQKHEIVESSPGALVPASCVDRLDEDEKKATETPIVQPQSMLAMADPFGKLETVIREGAIIGDVVSIVEACHSEQLEEEAQDMRSSAMDAKENCKNVHSHNQVQDLLDKQCPDTASDQTIAKADMQAARVPGGSTSPDQLDLPPLDLSLDFLGGGVGSSSWEEVEEVAHPEVARDAHGEIPPHSPMSRHSDGEVDVDVMSVGDPLGADCPGEPSLEDLVRLKPADLQFVSIHDRLGEKLASISAQGSHAGQLASPPSQLPPAGHETNSEIPEGVLQQDIDKPLTPEWLRERYGQLRNADTSRPASRSSGDMPRESLKELTSLDAFQKKLQALSTTQLVPLAHLPPPPDFAPPTCSEVTQPPLQLQALIDSCGKP
jgi:hypothetical protein